MKQSRMILCRSQSEALLLSRKLSACGIDARLARPPRSPKVRFCSWGLEIETQASDWAADCLADMPPDVWSWEDGG